MEPEHTRQAPNQSATLTVADQLLARLVQHKRTTNKPRRFFIPSASEVFPAYFKYMVEEKNRIFESNEDVDTSLLRIGQWMEDSNAPAGLLLAGTPGNGKTTAIKALQLLVSLSGYQDPVNYDSYGRPDRAYLHMVNAYDLVSLYSENETRYQFLKKTGLLAIDDVGLEPLEFSKYSNVISPFLDLFYYRYENDLMTILTTNLTTSMLNERYGARVEDRFNEMMYRVSFPLVSFRHNEYGMKKNDQEKA